MGRRGLEVEKDASRRGEAPGKVRVHLPPTQTSLLFRPCSTPPLGCRSERLPTTQALCPGYQEHLG